MYSALSIDERPPMNRIIMDELPRKTHEHCSGFHFSSLDEATGRSHTSSIGATSDFRLQQSTKKETGDVVGKVTFYRDSEVATHPVERAMGNWVK